MRIYAQSKNMQFAIQYSPISSKEAVTIIQYSIMEKVPYVMVKDIDYIPEDHIPVGSIEFCEKALGIKIVPDHYPAFLEKHLYRKIYKSETWPLGKNVFIKPSDVAKRFTGFVTNGVYCDENPPPYWCSEVVQFTNEWRYYVADGKILTGEWYNGDDVNVPDAPQLNIDIPEDYCGAIDFGLLTTGELALVEANHPFACGWYGKDYKIYAEWVIRGWEYMIKLVREGNVKHELFTGSKGRE